MKKFFILFLFTSILGCSEEEPSLTASFFKIYDDSNFDLSYHPLDVVETVDGFVILAGTELDNSSFDGVQLIKVDKEGNFAAEIELADYEAPVGDLYLNSSDSNVYFFVKASSSVNAVLIAVNPDLEIQNEIPLGGLNYPLSASITSNGSFLLQSYDPVNFETEISEIDLSGAILNAASYSIGPGDDVEVDIIEHFTGALARPLPFFSGEVSPGNYFFNGFYNYSFSLVFTSFGDSPGGVVQGQGTNAGIRAAMALGGCDFAIAGYQFDDNYQLASTTLATSGISSSADLYPGDMAEIKPYTYTKIINYATASSEHTVFVAETKSNQIVLHFYDNTTGEIDGVYHVGYLNPYSFASVRVTEDESILVLGTTFVAGRFERIVLNKISKSEIEAILN